MNAKLIPSLPDNSILRVEAEGGLFLRRSGTFKPVSLSDLKLLREIDGVSTAYSIVKQISESITEMACGLIRISVLVNEGIISLQPNPSAQPKKACVGKNLPFSKKAFSTPVLVSLAVTRECNRECVHCYRKAVDQRGAIDSACFRAIVDSLAGMDIAILNITGGEPFVHEDIVDLARFAATKINCVTISTNGTLLERSILRDISQGGVKNLQIGLNAIYDTQHGFDEEGFGKVFKSIRIAFEEGIRVVGGVVLTRNTIGSLDEIFRHSSESGVSSIRLGPLMNVHPGCASLSVSAEDVLDAASHASMLSRDVGLHVDFVDGLADPRRVLIDPAERRHYCYLGTGILHIEPDGSLFPCSALVSDEFCIGKMSSQPTIDEFSEIWRGSEILGYLREVTIDSIETCAGCEIRSRCCGGCRTAAYWNTGSIIGENPFCSIAKGCLTP